eukprot:TRINITY_DN3793_c0_g4_i1.p1 TRINITY_DN3793_c0_g4~~TRINITY_DN3793_c0_g4_i1.p1  ORF type:complete len:291 (+),score=69.92 TRINITY_DN3793_c0_g4_i1:47-919(+)
MAEHDDHEDEVAWWAGGGEAEEDTAEDWAGVPEQEPQDGVPMEDWEVAPAPVEMGAVIDNGGAAYVDTAQAPQDDVIEVMSPEVPETPTPPAPAPAQAPAHVVAVDSDDDIDDTAFGIEVTIKPVERTFIEAPDNPLGEEADEDEDWVATMDITDFLPGTVAMVAPTPQAEHKTKYAPWQEKLRQDCPRCRVVSVKRGKVFVQVEHDVEQPNGETQRKIAEWLREDLFLASMPSAAEKAAVLATVAPDKKKKGKQHKWLKVAANRENAYAPYGKGGKGGGKGKGKGGKRW